ncbi:MAG: cyanophycin synthetase [Gammaproteobacteria bacterium]|nr:MAG: cyanophycin synthetase [Gammaproteobacteria bacterium]
MKSPKTLLYQWISRHFLNGCSNYNTLEVRRASRSKKLARDMFAANDLPHAAGLVFVNPLKAWRFAREHGYPLCIKPNVGGFSRGSHFPINNAGEFWRAMALVKLWWPSSVVERYLEGVNYRVLATDTDLVSVIRRYPPYVDGNGRDSIATLIDAENAVREEMQLFPTVRPLRLNAETRRHLARQGLDEHSVPWDGERVTLFHRLTLASGGVVETVNRSTIPAANRELFLKVVKLFDARLFGIDIILEKGMETDWREQKCILLEVNSRPFTRMHEFPRFGPVDDLADFHHRMKEFKVDGAQTF